jgi:hypothetical protein
LRVIRGGKLRLRNHATAIALHVAHYNFCRVHETLRITPAMAKAPTSSGAEFTRYQRLGDEPHPSLAPVSIVGLNTHLTQLARLDVGEGAFKSGNKRPEELDLVAARDQDNDGNVPPSDGLLVLDLSVNGDQDLELRFGQAKQFAVLLAGPTHFRSRVDLMASKLTTQPLRHALVKQQSHVG